MAHGSMVLCLAPASWLSLAFLAMSLRVWTYHVVYLLRLNQALFPSISADLLWAHSQVIVHVPENGRDL